MRGPVIVTFLTFIGFAVVYPILPFQALGLGATPQLVTVLLVVEPLTAALVAPLAGNLSDRVGRRPVILLLLGLALPAYLLLAIADSLWLLFASRLLAGASTAISPVIQAYLADVTSSEDRVAGMAGINAAYCLAFIAGPLIASVALGIEGNNYTAVAAAGATAALAATALAAFCLSTSKPATALAEKASGQQQQRTLAFAAIPRAGCARLVAVLALFGLVYAAMDTTLGLWLDGAAGWGARELSFAFAIAGAAAFTALCAIRRLIAPFGEAGAAIGCACALALGFVALLIDASWFGLVPAMILLGAGMAVGTSCLQGMISKAAPAESQGLVLGQSDALFSAASIAGPLAAGLVIAELGIVWPYVICSALCLAAVPLLISGGWSRRLAPSRASQLE